MTPPDRNVAQIDYWNGEVGRRWAQLQDRLDGLFGTITALALDAAAPRPGERAIDIGCGCGATVIELARRVGPSGWILGVDVSQVMLDVAEARIAAEGIGAAGVTLADAAIHPFAPGMADLVFSRFGVMFFDAPAEAFAHIRAALKPEGRISFVCWRALSDNGWVSVPMEAARPCLEAEAEPPADPHAPGPFAFADANRVRAILEEAGFSAIEIVPRDAMLHLAPPGDLKAAAALITQVGPVSRALKHVDAPCRAVAEEAVAAALVAYDGPEGVRLPGAVWIVTARA